jgi:hypothetical protein
MNNTLSGFSFPQVEGAQYSKHALGGPPFSCPPRCPPPKFSSVRCIQFSRRPTECKTQRLSPSFNLPCTLIVYKGEREGEQRRTTLPPSIHTSDFVDYPTPSLSTYKVMLLAVFHPSPALPRRFVPPFLPVRSLRLAPSLTSSQQWPSLLLRPPRRLSLDSSFS